MLNYSKSLSLSGTAPGNLSAQPVGQFSSRFSRPPSVCTNIGHGRQVSLKPRFNSKHLYKYINGYVLRNVITRVYIHLLPM